MTDSMDPLNGLVPVPESSPSSSDSVHIPHMHDNTSFYANSAGRWFPQIILLAFGTLN